MSVAPEFPPLVTIPERARQARGPRPFDPESSRRRSARAHLALVPSAPVVPLAPPARRPDAPLIRIDLSRPSISEEISPALLLDERSISDVPLRLTRRGVLASWLLAGVIAAVVLSVAYLSWSPNSARPTMAQSVVTVQPGDTLWSIAGAVAPGRDPRAEVDQLVRLNHLASGSLTPGQQLRLH